MRRNDLFYGNYGHFEAEVLARIRRKTFGEEFGQNSWTTGGEYRKWVAWLALDKNSRVLEVASGSGGPAIFLAQLSGCSLVGVDIDPNGLAVAAERARAEGLNDRLSFQEASADSALPFSDSSFDAVICIDAANHFAKRLFVLQEWRRVLKPGGRAVFTDPVVITGLVAFEELAIRSSIGYFLFAPAGVNEKLIEEAGLKLLRSEDGTENEAAVSKRWHDARVEERDALLKMEGEEKYRRLQEFFTIVHRLTSERRLSRIVYLAQKPQSH